MNPDLACRSVRSSIRQYLPLLPVEDATDLVVLATALHSISPDRTEPLWICLVGYRDAGRDDLLELLAKWSRAWTLPHGDVLDYLTGRKAKTHRCRLERAKLEDGGKRLLLMPSLNGFSRWDAEEPWRSIHSGALRRQTRTGAVTVEWEPEERLNAIASMSVLKDWRRSEMNGYGLWLPWRMLAQRPRETKRARALIVAASEMNERNAREPFRKQQAETAVLRFLEESFPRLTDVKSIELSGAQDSRLRDCAELCRRIATVDLSDDEAGNAVHRAAATLVRYVAWIRGASYPEECDLEVGLRLCASQLLRADWGILRYVNQPPLLPPALRVAKCQNRGMNPEKVLRSFDRLDRAGVGRLELGVRMTEITLRIPKASYDLLRSIDPHRTIFPVIVSKRREIVEEPDEDLAAEDSPSDLDASSFMARFQV